jgi:hypothetical protein
MDPKVCLLDAQEAIVDDCYTTARILVSEYRAFRARGGFEPRMRPAGSFIGHEMGDALASELESLLENT